MEYQKPSEFVGSGSPRCVSCRHWREITPGDFDSGEQRVPYDLFPHNAEYDPQPLSFRVGHCASPYLKRIETPTGPEDAVVWDASNYVAVFITAEQFGCVHHSPR